jgi:hypothetical protein
MRRKRGAHGLLHVAGNHNTCVMTFAGAMANKLQKQFGPELQPRMR